MSSVGASRFSWAVKSAWGGDASAAAAPQLSAVARAQQSVDRKRKAEETIAEKAKRMRAEREAKEKRMFDDELDPDINWKAPSGQTGDGRTALNDKLGY